MLRAVMLQPRLETLDRLGVHCDDAPFLLHAKLESARGERFHLAAENRVASPLPTVGLHVKCREELPHAVVNFHVSVTSADRFGADMHHDETRRGPVTIFGTRGIATRTPNAL